LIDLLPLLLPHLSSPSCDSSPAGDEILQCGDLRWDVAALLGLLHGQDICPLYGRWLPPRAVKELNARLSVPEEVGKARSERKVRRLSFVHYLAEVAGLIGLSGGYLKPTLLAWDWLGAPPREQYRCLWDRWCESSAVAEELWHRFRLPGHETAAPLAVRDRVLRHLAELDPEAWTAVAGFVHQIKVRDAELAILVPGEGETAKGMLRELLVGPLTWLGVVTWREERDTSVSSAFRVSDLGGWLLGQREAPALESSVRPFVLHRDGSVEVQPTCGMW